MAEKTKLYNVTKIERKEYVKNSFYEFIVYMFAYSIILLIGTKIFNGFYIENFGYAFLASCIISFFNAFLKPALIVLTLPITILSYGILYPLSNMIILWLTSLLLGSHFVLGGLLSTFFLSIFISLLKIIVDKLFVKKVVKGV